MNNTTSFEQALESFVAGCQRMVTENDKSYANVQFNTTLSIDPKGRKYIRIVRTDSAGGRSVHCFVNKTNGDVLKAAGWKAPAKHARGNIHDEYNGMKWMGVYGPAYLR